MSDGTDARRETATLALLAAVARRAGVAERLESAAGDAVLRSVVDAAVALIRAEAASIALHDPTTDRLVFRVAAGDKGQGVVGLSIGPDEGVAGYVLATGQPLAIAEAASDPRFGRAAAEQTGYMPRSLLAVPLADDAGTIGVLEVLDRRDGAPFDLRDMDAASVFARMATVAIRATRLERDTAHLLELSLRSLDGDLAGDDIDTLVTAAVADLFDDDATATWRLADLVARVRVADPGQVDLVEEILEALVRRAEHSAPGRYRSVGRL
ncbi:MAG TPA: GAF domain-containing protein [Candidatus Limnocylindrales bacterium]|nr:GAF domain-containing protein [Candidatus Limnocylindrales bacterium]